MSDRPRVVGGRYVLGSLLGRGGMAEVYRAVDTRLDRPVAVKQLSAHLAADSTAQLRFRREARAAARLNHPAIASVFDTGRDIDPGNEGHAVPYIVMELVEGMTLRALLSRGTKLSPERALTMTRTVLEALAHAHAAGIVHRDIKPANVMITPDGSVKVMDFGIARALNDTTTSLTEAAAVIGTAQYFSPEQASGESVDRRSDLYSVGCLLFELLTGRPPFVGESSISIAYQHVREAPPAPSQLNPAVGPAVDAFVLKALAKDRSERYQSAEEMSADLSQLLVDDGAAGPTLVIPAGASPARSSAGSPPTMPPVAPPGVPLVETVVAGPVAPPTVPSVVPPGVPLVEPAAVPRGREFGGGSALVAEPLASEGDGRSRRPGRAALVAVSIVLLLALAAFAFYRIFGTSEQASSMITVPPVIASTRAEADAAVRGAGLVPRFEQVHGKRDDTLNTVTRQTPLGGSRAEPGTMVSLEINVGPADAKIPSNIVGATLATAKKRLAAAGFTTVRAEPVTDPSGRIKAGHVASVDPGEGTSASAGEEVVLGYVPEDSTASATTRPTADPTTTEPKPSSPPESSEPTPAAETTQPPSPTAAETSETAPSTSSSGVQTPGTPAPSTSG